MTRCPTCDGELTPAIAGISHDGITHPGAGGTWCDKCHEWRVEGEVTLTTTSTTMRFNRDDDEICFECGAPRVVTDGPAPGMKVYWAHFDANAVVRDRLATMPTSVIAGAVDTAFIAATSRDWDAMRAALLQALVTK